MAQSFVKCEICDERECAMICLDCDQYFCQKCKEGHIKTKTTKHHQFLDSGTFQPQFKKLRCTQHEHHFIFFCERCQTLVCPICLPENHQEHRMLKIDKVASIKKKELNETLKIFVTKLNEFESEVNSIQSITEKCKGENKYVIQHVDEQAKHISNVIENQRRCIIESVKQKAKTEEKRISILLEDLQHCMKEAKELERKVKLDIQGSETSLLSNFQLRKSKLDTFEFNDTTISTCPVQFAKYNVPKEELSLLESVFSSNLCGLSEHEERNTLKSMMSKHDRNIHDIEELQKELTNQIQISATYSNQITALEKNTKILQTENIDLTTKMETLKFNSYEALKKAGQQYNVQLEAATIEITKLQKQIVGKKCTVAKLEKLVSNVCDEISSKNKQVKDLMTEKENIQNRFRLYSNSIEQRLQEKEQNEQRLICLLNEKDQMIAGLNEKVDQIATLQKEHSAAVHMEKEYLQTRLSSIAGDKLTKRNPAITDFGDPNRPMKIGEMYGELYDNEWTDAMDCTDKVKRYYPDLDANEVEEIVIRHLYRLLMCSYHQCIQLSKEQLCDIRTYTLTTLRFDTHKDDDVSSFPGRKEIIMARRQNTDETVKFFLEHQIIGDKIVLQGWEYEHKNENLILDLLKTPFFERCIKLCWFIALQDPMMHLEEDITPGSAFDKNIFKEFVQSGNCVNYVVWPALFLHRHGPLLYKGVVQAYWQK
ncbi:uncharacterized protein [Mytilus edulis]|uniref:uncharacterized protein n=1 Tax=Mytilus edulis TaxID=6550 RepID=UPI0039EE2F00